MLQTTRPVLEIDLECSIPLHGAGHAAKDFHLPALDVNLDKVHWAVANYVIEWDDRYFDPPRERLYGRLVMELSPQCRSDRDNTALPGLAPAACRWVSMFLA